ncbi:MAG: aminoglycoside phosphotransferase family protein [Actinomycetota bacterium]
MPTDEPTDPLARFEAAVRARVGADADEWLEGLPDLISSVRATWDLLITGPAREVDAFGMTIPATRADEGVLLRMAFPDGWFADETTALEAWNGEGAVRLLESDPRGAHVRAAPVPGTTLGAERNAMRGLRLIAEALRTLWIAPPPGLQTLSAEVREWNTELASRFEAAHRPFERQLLSDAQQLLRTFGPTQTAQVLLHGDARLDAFVMDGDRAVAIDPKPLVGEPAFDVASLLRDTPADLVADPVAGRQLLQGRLDQLTDQLDVEPSRVKGWAFAVAVDTGLVAYEGGDPNGGDLMLEVARLCQSLTV